MHLKRRNEGLEWNLRHDRDASKPFNQFQEQVAEEKDRIIAARENSRNPSRTGTSSTDPTLEDLERNVEYENQAIETIKGHWIKQGIWEERWAKDLDFLNAKWKHESFLKDKLWRIKTLFQSKKLQPHPPVQSSRPAAQFACQIVLEIERILKEVSDPFQLTEWELYTRAFEKVKGAWVERGIWSDTWDDDWPGPRWKHEERCNGKLADWVSVTPALGQNRH
jgi:hypothetical protein